MGGTVYNRHDRKDRELVKGILDSGKAIEQRNVYDFPSLVVPEKVVPENPWASELEKARTDLSVRVPFEYSSEGAGLIKRHQQQAQKGAQLAKKDAVGQLTALTGGYGSSYAQAKGEEIYNSTMQDSLEIIPELYQLALARYNNETAEMQGEFMDVFKKYNSWDNTPVTPMGDTPAKETEPLSLSEIQKLDDTFLELANEGKYKDILFRLESLPLGGNEKIRYMSLIPEEWLETYYEGGDLDLVEGNAEKWISKETNVEKWTEIILKVITAGDTSGLTDEERKIYQMLAPLTDGLPS